MTASARRSQILKVAGLAFARDGFAGATTYAIAAAAGISEALLFRHFRTKRGLFLAVLRELLRQQDRRIKHGEGAQGRGDLVFGLRAYFRACVGMTEQDEEAAGLRVLMASLAADGRYARAIYRRALRKRGKLLRGELEKAQRAGETHGRIIDPRNALFFIENIGSMMALSRLNPNPVIPYGDDDEALIEDAVLFCIRGLGFDETVAAMPNGV
jgi:AcrR family transcriptional regulator